MSEQSTPDNVVREDSAGSESPQSDARQAEVPKARPAKTVGRLVAVAVILLAIAGGGSWFLTHRSKSVVPPKTVAGTNQPISVQVTELQAQGKTGEAVQKLNSQIGSTSDKSQKGQLYELKAETYLGQNDYTDALAAAKLAESLSPTPNSIQLMAQSEAGLGDKTAAIADYQQAATRYAKNGDLSSQQDMQTAAKALGGS